MNRLPWRKDKEQGAKHPVLSLRDEMNKLFDGFFGRQFPAPWGAEEWAPALDVSETDAAVVVRAEVPGLEPKDLELAVAGNVLTISGEKKQEREERERAWHRSERLYGSFARSVTLPAEVDVEKVSAAHKNGVLTVTLPKLEPAKRRKIKVQVS